MSQTTPPVSDVIVVGAGPSGCRAARRLAERGHDVLVVDENPGAREQVVCTGIIGREAFDRLDLPRPPVRDHVRRAAFFSPAGVRVDHEPPRPLAAVVDRTAFDDALASEARAAGARILRRRAARGVRVGEDGVRVRVEAPGRVEVMRARVLVVATGHQRWLHRATGLGDPPGYVHGVHADLPFRGLEAAELYFGRDVAPGFFAWAVPFGDGTARLGVLARQGARRLFGAFLRREAIRSRLGVPLDDGGRKLARRRLRSRGIVQGRVTPDRADRVVAVGEAAGQVKTTTAGGIYYGLVGAERAAGALDRALRTDRLDAASLASYSEGWWGELGPEIRAGLALQGAVRGLEDADVDALFRALNDGVGAAVREAVRFDWHRAALQVLFAHDRARGHLSRGALTSPALVS